MTEKSEDLANRPIRPVEENAWTALRRFTDARIALGRAGASLPTAPLLAFTLAHAQARDAVHAPLDTQALIREIESRALASIEVHSAAQSREQYLRRPDLGRMLDAPSAARLAQHAASGRGRPDLVFVIADGLSAKAAASHALPLIDRTLLRLVGWHIGPIVVATQARVAIGDAIGELMNANMVAVLIGERPGLSSPASLGVYLTYQPRVGRTDAQRNCISNVRPEGLGYDAAAFKLAHLAEAARVRQLTGIALKDESVWDGSLLSGDGAGGPP
ncbi:MAG: ethanolamine ammonia-lyase subunit EutC [Paraburkholderia sp.]|nr:MAG: ethanolamine ammonia-lyase subunit EutC [Paraburkholderia sp.]